MRKNDTAKKKSRRDRGVMRMRGKLVDPTPFKAQKHRVQPCCCAFICCGGLLEQVGDVVLGNLMALFNLQYVSLHDCACSALRCGAYHRVH